MTTRCLSVVLLATILLGAQTQEPEHPVPQDPAAKLKADIDRVLAQRFREIRTEIHQLVDRAVAGQGPSSFERLLAEMSGATGPQGALDPFAALGARVQALDPSLVVKMGEPTGRAHLFLELKKESPLASLGLKPGEVMLNPRPRVAGDFEVTVLDGRATRVVTIPGWIAGVLAGQSWARSEPPESAGSAALSDPDLWDTKKLLKDAQDRALSEVLGERRSPVLAHPPAPPPGEKTPSPRD